MHFTVLLLARFQLLPKQYALLLPVIQVLSGGEYIRYYYFILLQDFDLAVRQKLSLGSQISVFEVSIDVGVIKLLFYGQT